MPEEIRDRISRGLAARLAVRLTPQGEWAEQGLCREVDPELFFPEKGDPVAARDAKEICSWCPVKAACASWALETRELHGIWGGLSVRDRERLWRAAA